MVILHFESCETVSCVISCQLLETFFKVELRGKKIIIQPTLSSVIYVVLILEREQKEEEKRWESLFLLNENSKTDIGCFFKSHTFSS